jgi:UDPglucose 6-dehydrogenase
VHGDLGFQVTCVDNAEDKIRALEAGQVPIYEPGLDQILRATSGRSGSTSRWTGKAAIQAADVVYIAVGTPSAPDGSADLSGVLAVAQLIGDNLRRPATVIIKSTVPVGTADQVREMIQTRTTQEFDVVSNPEFLKEGAAVEDFMRPDRIVIGCKAPRSRAVMEQLYASLVRTGRPILFMDNRSAELTKYASNALLATKISFMNELSRLCEKTGADIELVRKGAGADTRIGPRFLFAGAGYGGSCFPKDVKALCDTAKKYGMTLSIADAVERVNYEQKHVLGTKVKARFGQDLSSRRFCLWGLAFKPETDDMREAPALVLAEDLLAAGIRRRLRPGSNERGQEAPRRSHHLRAQPHPGTRGRRRARARDGMERVPQPGLPDREGAPAPAGDLRRPEHLQPGRAARGGFRVLRDRPSVRRSSVPRLR